MLALAFAVKVAPKSDFATGELGIDAREEASKLFFDCRSFELMGVPGAEAEAVFEIETALADDNAEDCMWVGRSSSNISRSEREAGGAAALVRAGVLASGCCCCPVSLEGGSSSSLGSTSSVEVIVVLPLPLPLSLHSTPPLLLDCCARGTNNVLADAADIVPSDIAGKTEEGPGCCFEAELALEADEDEEEEEEEEEELVAKV
jgi:hypothetical protein